MSIAISNNNKSKTKTNTESTNSIYAVANDSYSRDGSLSIFLLSKEKYQGLPVSVDAPLVILDQDVRLVSNILS